MESGRDFNGDVVRAVHLLMVASFAALVLTALVFLWTGWLKNGLVAPVPEPGTTTAPVNVPTASGLWHPPDPGGISGSPAAEEIRYGRELVAHTAKYLGPKGSVAQTSNGMNCQNCHLDAGTKVFGNNYAAVASTYPKFRARSGTLESIEKRVNDCFERSLNGERLEDDSREMKAIVRYIEWLGADVRKGESPKGAGLAKMQPLARAADPAKGRVLYESQCVVCHGGSGEGIKVADGTEYLYPPLWGKSSYNYGAGLYRLSTFAQFIRVNMPLGTTYENPVLSEEEAWDIAAYVNSLPRPGKDLSADWPDISKKPFDHPFGPYADPFSETQHKYGPFRPITDFYASKTSR